MAVIRASRLWALRVFPASAESVTTPSPSLQPESPEVSEPGVRSLISFICPAGSKAILRTMTMTLNAVPTAGTQPSAAAWIQPVGAIPYRFHWFWFVDNSVDPPLLRLDSLWNGQLVLTEGDQIIVGVSVSGDMDSTGSGHILPIQA